MADFDIYSPGDVFDSRDVIERWDELEAEHEALQEAIDKAAEHVARSLELVEKTKNRVEEYDRNYDIAMQDDDVTEEQAKGYADDLEEAKQELSQLEDELAENEESLKDAERAMEEWTDYEEYAALKDFVESASGYGDWDHGETFIADSYFEEYARELAEDIGGKAIRDAEWPMNCIDWEAAAEQLKADYTSYELPGKGGNTVTYWARS